MDVALNKDNYKHFMVTFYIPKDWDINDENVNDISYLFLTAAEMKAYPNILKETHETKSTAADMIIEKHKNISTREDDVFIKYNGYEVEVIEIDSSTFAFKDRWDGVINLKVDDLKDKVDKMYQVLNIKNYRKE
ncbi:uncharacterized protein LOC122511953 [Leptopilina heterotoma]|uniref:uncharacterized protein LOC122511953 n=1 Tax=Leptopilina heterotoma TaxID=63436 RepID=UPI001CA96AD1|nr:uncharacterized protein LOC122511953 [Leptopilina heterotoma]